jgi:protein SCO1
VPVSGKRLLLGCLAIVVIAVGVVGATIAMRPPDPKLDDLGEVGTFSLTDDRGAQLTDAALRGHVTIVSFLFTRCDTICPVTTMKMQLVQEKTFDVGDRVKLASFSVDPGYDTPERLAAYSVKYRADAARWRFITGPADAMRKVVEGVFMTSMMKEQDRPNGIPNIAHAGYFMLVDPTGHIRGHYDSNDIHKLDELIRDARFLARTMM